MTIEDIKAESDFKADLGKALLDGDAKAIDSLKQEAIAARWRDSSEAFLADLANQRPKRPARSK